MTQSLAAMKGDGEQLRLSFMARRNKGQARTVRRPAGLGIQRVPTGESARPAPVNRGEPHGGVGRIVSLVIRSNNVGYSLAVRGKLHIAHLRERPEILHYNGTLLVGHETSFRSANYSNQSSMPDPCGIRSRSCYAYGVTVMPGPRRHEALRS